MALESLSNRVDVDLSDIVEEILDLRDVKLFNITHFAAEAMLICLATEDSFSEYNNEDLPISAKFNQNDEQRDVYTIVFRQFVSKYKKTFSMDPKFSHISDGLKNLKSYNNRAEDFIDEVNGVRFTLLRSINEEDLTPAKEFEVFSLDEKAFFSLKIKSILERIPPTTENKEELLRSLASRTRGNKGDNLFNPIREWDVETSKVIESENNNLSTVISPVTEISDVNYTVGYIGATIKKLVRGQNSSNFSYVILTILQDIDSGKLSEGSRVLAGSFSILGIPKATIDSACGVLNEMGILKEENRNFFVLKKPNQFDVSVILLGLNQSDLIKINKSLSYVENIIVLINDQINQEFAYTVDGVRSKWKNTKIKSAPKSLALALNTLMKAPIPFMDEDGNLNKIILDKQLPFNRVNLKSDTVPDNIFPCWIIPRFYKELVPVEIGITIIEDSFDKPLILKLLVKGGGSEFIDIDTWMENFSSNIDDFTPSQIKNYIIKISDFISNFESSFNENSLSAEIEVNRLSAFLSLTVPILEYFGVSVILPEWYDDNLENAKISLTPYTNKGSSSVSGELSVLNIINRFDWKIAIGQNELNEEQLQELINRRQEFYRTNGSVKRIDLQYALGAMNLTQIDNPLVVLSQVESSISPFSGYGIDLDEVRGIISFLSRNKSEFPKIDLPKDIRDGVELDDIQLEAFSWHYHYCQNGIGTCNAFTMGLGKTVVALVLLQKLKENLEETAKLEREMSLVICPTSLKNQWFGSVREKEGAAFFTPNLNVEIFEKDKIIDSSKTDVVVVSYGHFLRNKHYFLERNWNCVITDEAQVFKNIKSNIAKSLKQCKSNSRVALSGTPFENNLDELYSLMEWLNPGMLGTRSFFSKNIVRPIEKQQDKQVLSTLQDAIHPFIFRVSIDDERAKGKLPKVNREIKEIVLDVDQVAQYKDIIERARARILGSNGGSLTGIALYNQLVLPCNHPGLMDSNLESEDDKSPKLKFLKEKLSENMGNGESSLVFSPSKKSLFLFYNRLVEHLGEGSVFIYHGGLSPKEREVVLGKVRAGDKPKVCLLSLRAAATGLNLQVANHVYHLSRWWNPFVELQANYRAARYGGKKEVFSTALTTRGTVESIVDKRMQDKEDLFQAIFSMNGKEVKKSDRKDSMLRFLDLLNSEIESI